MNEKRFSIYELVHYDEEQDKWVDCDRYCITDNERHINYDLKFDEKQLCSLLNEKEERIKTLEKENKRLAKNLKTAKNNVDANFKSAQYWRQKFESIAEKHQEDLDRMSRKDVIQTKSRCQDCEYFHNFGEINICGHGITDRHVFKPEGLTKCSSWIMRTIKK